MASFSPLHGFVSDLRYGARLLRRSPAFTLVAVVSLAIGIGASAAVFSLADAVLLRELRVPSPSRLIGFRWIVAGPEGPASSLTGNMNRTETETTSTSFSLGTFRTLRDRSSRAADVFGFADMYRVNLAWSGNAAIGSGHLVSGNYFRALGVAAAAGRTLTDDDDRPGAAPVAMISHGYWQERFGGDPSAVGRLMTINGVPCTIVGVMPRRFRGAGRVGQSMDVAAPLGMHDTLLRTAGPGADPDYWWVLIMARLRDGVTGDEARGQLDLLLKQSVAEGKPSLVAARMPRLVLFPGARGQEDSRARMRDTIRMMVLVVAIVLLVACTNVANLLLARGRTRAREMAVRAAIGAPRVRMVRQLLTEGVLLAMLGAAGGLLVARYLAAAMLPALTRSTSETPLELAADWRFLGFTVVVASVCSVLFALAPAFRTSKVQLATDLQAGSRGVVGHRRRATLASSLVVTQVALCLLLVTTAGLLVGSVRNLERVPLGFDPSSLLLFRADPSLNGYDTPRVKRFYEDALGRLRGIAGVRSATILTHPLISGGASTSRVYIPGRPVPATPIPDQSQLVYRQNVDGAFFTTMGIPVLQGRAFDASDTATTRMVALVNARFAERFYPGESAIGRHFSMSTRPGAPVFEIIGVVGNAKYTDLRQDSPNCAYLYFAQQPVITSATFAVKTASDPLALADQVRAAVAGVDGHVPLYDVRTQEMQIRERILIERLMARLAMLLGAVVLLLAAIGLYGVVAYSVARRTPEIGIRMALGAERSRVRAMVLRESLLLAVVGVLVGVPAALVGTRVVRTLLFGLEPRDPLTLAAAAGVMLAVALLAACIPARRASRMDPLVALRTE